MKYINKDIRSEPATLNIYRNTTPDASYNGFVDTYGLLKRALLTEQGFLCGYCMKLIPYADGRFTSVEHYISQKKHENSNYTLVQHKTHSLRYNNMLAVCKNNGKHCDESRGNIPFKILNPHNKICETHIKYTLSGKIESRNNPLVDFDIEILKLNCQSLKDLRSEFWETAKNKLITKHPKGTWSKNIIELERQHYIERQSGKHRAFCNYIIFRFNHLLSLPKYQQNN